MENKAVKHEKQFYRLKEVVALGVLPYNSESTLRRLIHSGAIQAVRHPTKRAHYFVTAHEIDRLVGLVRENQDISSVLETKSAPKKRRNAKR